MKALRTVLTEKSSDAGMQQLMASKIFPPREGDGALSALEWLLTLVATQAASSCCVAVSCKMLEKLPPHTKHRSAHVTNIHLSILRFSSVTSHVQLPYNGVITVALS